MTQSSNQKLVDQQILLAVTLLVVAMVGCSSPPTRKFTDSAIPRSRPNPTPLDEGVRFKSTSMPGLPEPEALADYQDQRSASASGSKYLRFNRSTFETARETPSLVASDARSNTRIEDQSIKEGSIILAAASVFTISEQAETRSPTEATEKAKTDTNEQKGETSDPGQENEQKPIIGVQELVQQAIAIHPKIQAAQSRIAAAQFRIPQARALPDPIAETLFWPIANNAQQLASGRMTNQLSLSQTVPWTEKLRVQAEVAAREVGMAQAEMREIEREIAESVRLAYYEVWFSEHAYQIVQENRKLSEQIVNIAQNRFRSGGSQQDVIRAELEVEKRDQQLLELSQQLEVAQADLATLVQQPIDFSIETTQKLLVSDTSTQLDTLLATAEQCNPTLQGLAWQIQRDLQKQRLAALQKYPDLTYGVQYGMMSTSQAISPVADGIDNISFSVGTTLPIWKKKIQAGICQAASERNSSAQLHQSEWNSIAGRLRRLVQQADSLEKQRTLYVEKLIPRAEQAFEISQSEYTVGKISFIQWIDNFSEVLMFRVEVVRIEASLAGVLAQVERTVGCETTFGSE